MSTGDYKRRKILHIIFWTLTVAWLAFCLYLSWQIGEETGQFSQQIARFLLDLLGKLGIRPDAQQFHVELLLFAHYSVFFVTGILVAGALTVSLPQDKGWTVFWISAVSCVLIAVLAEVGKLAVPGRHLTWSEVCLNVLGALCGAAVSYLAIRLCTIWRAMRTGFIG